MTNNDNFLNTQEHADAVSWLVKNAINFANSGASIADFSGFVVANFFVKINPKRQGEENQKKYEQAQAHYQKIIGDIKGSINTIIPTKNDELENSVNEALKTLDNLPSEPPVKKEEIINAIESEKLDNAILDTGVIHRSLTPRKQLIKYVNETITQSESDSFPSKEQAEKVATAMIAGGLLTPDARDAQIKELMRMSMNAFNSLIKLVNDGKIRGFVRLSDNSSKELKTKHTNPKRRSSKKNKANKKAAKK